MFHVRNILTQSNLSLQKQLSAINNYKYLSNKVEQQQIKPLSESINLSESCVKRLKELEENKKFLRVIVESGGCSGLEYKFSLDSNITKEDKVIEKEGCKVLIDNETIGFIKGSTLDYYEELIRSGFRIINNPNSEHGCSCGTSFSIKI